MKLFIVFIFSLVQVVFLMGGNMQCHLPPSISNISVSNKLKILDKYPDIHRNHNILKKLCVDLLSFREGAYRWDLFLIRNPKHQHGAVWFLPHDNENSAFDAGLYAIKRYGGSMLTVISGGNRYHQGQDPNRNFSNSKHKLSSCRYQKAASPIYTNIIFSIIDAFKSHRYPYLALHNNTNQGGVSVLRSSSAVRSYLAYPIQTIKRGIGLSDEDSLVYIAGTSKTPPKNKLNKLLKNGLNVKYEYVSNTNNDCSMSNYVVLGKNSTKYYNIEAQHGNTATQKRMIDILMKKILR